MTQIESDVVRDITDFYNSWYRDDIARLAQRYPKTEKVLEISFKDLRRGLPDLAEDIFANPEFVHDHLLVALQEYDHIPHAPDFEEAEVQIVDIDSADELSWTIGQFTPSELNSEFSILRGQVTRATQTQQRFERVFYTCQRCGTADALNVPKDADELPEPHECAGCERQGPFSRDKERMEEYGIDHQMLRLQTPPEHADQATASMDVIVEGEFTQTADPGDRVTVGAGLDVIINEDGNGPPTGEYRANARSMEVTDTDFSAIDYAEYEEEIEDIANSINPYERIIDSILPSHHGDRRIKEAIAYQLVEGVSKTKGDGSETRGKLHILLIGDPGVGKSQLLRYVNRISPRSIFTMGSGSTEAGLTCAAVQDDFGDSGWTLKAGALVEAHNGICLIDELDDMDEDDRSSMSTAMSDGEINVSKAGMTDVTMPSETSVLAAANPKFGRFDEFEPIGEQVDIADNLITRFDLIFTMTDTPDPEVDEEIAEKVLQSNADAVAREKRSNRGHDEDQPDIPPEVLRAYIARAREVVPELTAQAHTRIKSHYIDLRGEYEGPESPVPVTARTLETLVRLTEASARLRLSETATQDDAQRAIEIYMTYMARVGMDPETSELDADMVETGSSKTQQKRRKQVYGLIETLGKEYDSGAPHDAIIDNPELEKLTESKIENAIQKLKDKGEVYEPRDQHYRTT